MLSPAPATKLSIRRETKDCEVEKAKKAIVVKAVPPHIIHFSSSLPDISEEGYDTAPYPKDKAPTSRPTDSLESCIDV